MYRHGRRLAKRSNSLRSATLTLRKPLPTGVVIGPLIATRVRATESRTYLGSGVPCFGMTSAPASTVSHSIFTPVASTIRRIASVSSGPVPSPGIRVTVRIDQLLGVRKRGCSALFPPEHPESPGVQIVSHLFELVLLVARHRRSLGKTDDGDETLLGRGIHHERERLALDLQLPALRVLPARGA